MAIWLENKRSALAVKKNCEIFSRIVGYLRPVSQWNEGKQAEFKLRTTFDTKKEYHQSKHQDLSLA